MATLQSGSEPATERLHTVRRALAVLEALAARPGGATPKELSLALDLHLSTCYRLLNTLVASGYAFRGADRLFRLGARVAYIYHGYVKGLSPPPEALAFVHTLQFATGETATFSQLEGDDVVTAVIARGTRPGAVSPGYVGMAAPAHVLAAGRALLAGMSSERIEAYLARHCTATGSVGSVFSPAIPGALRDELARIRAAGYTVDYGEGDPEVCCVAAPVIDGDGAIVAAITTVLSCTRLRQEEASLIAVVLEVARAISALQMAAPAREKPAEAALLDPGGITEADLETAMAKIGAPMSRVG